MERGLDWMIRRGRLTAAVVAIAAILAGIPHDSLAGRPVDPDAVSDAYSTPHNETLTVSALDGVLNNDVVPPGSVVSLVFGPSYGVLTFNSDGSFVYTPDGGLVGDDQFAYQIAAGEVNPVATLDTSGTSVEPSGLAEIATVTISLTNSVPIPVPDAYVTNENTPLTVPAPGVLANDSDPDGDPIAITGVQDDVDHGTLAFDTATGGFVYTPNPGFTGDDSFVYGIYDVVSFPTKTASTGAVTAQGVSADTIVTITVLGVDTSTPTPTEAPAEPTTIPAEPTEVPGEPTAIPEPPAPTQTTAPTGGVTDLPDTGAAPGGPNSGLLSVGLVALLLGAISLVVRRTGRRPA